MLKIVIPAVLLLAGCQTTVAPARVLYPVERCGYMQEPIYGILDRPASEMEVLGGAAVGGIIGNGITNSTGGAIVGALLGGAIANDQRYQERVVVGQKEVYKCVTYYQ